MLDGAIQALKRKIFTPIMHVDANFRDSNTGQSEDGIDAGGPTLEFV